MGRLLFLLLLTAPPRPGAAQDAQAGFPVRNEAVVRACGACHTVDNEGMMGRISNLRKTPEGWQGSIRRMVSLHGVQLDPELAREVVRYLSNEHGIAPEELEPGRFEVERRLIEWRYDDPEMHQMCSACHSMGRVITQRRTAEEWKLLTETHRALYPIVDRQRFRNGGPTPVDARGDDRHPVDRAVEHLAEAFPLRTAEWAAWSASVRPPRLEGRWVVVGHDPARGPVQGEVVIEAVAGEEDAFTTRTTLVFPEDNTRLEREGRSVVYTGHQWRGRSGSGTAAEFREVLSVERDWATMTGRWFTGAHDELGVDVTLHRVGAGPLVAGVFPRALRSGSTGVDVRVFGANFPESVQAGEVDLGPGVSVRRVTRESDGVLIVQVDVDAGAAVGARDVRVAGAALPGAAVVFDRVDAIRILPRSAMARVGGVVMPARYAQFEAVGIHHGVDGRPDTDDDLDLGRVDADWSIDEFPVTYDDDDLGFVGSIDDRGFFTPAPDGPNPDRTQERSNVGDVWVVASYTPEENSEPPLRSRAQLLVSVPVYLEWDYWPERPLVPEADREAPSRPVGEGEAGAASSAREAFPGRTLSSPARNR